MAHFTVPVQQIELCKIYWKAGKWNSKSKIKWCKFYPTL